MDRREMLHAGISVVTGAIVIREVPMAEAAELGSQAAPTTSSRPLGAHPLGSAFGDWQGTMLEVNYPPGVTSASHQHPGPTFGYVVSGKVKWAINGEPAKVLEAGQSFFEPMGSVHSTSANASDTEPAKLSVVILSKPGEPLSKPAGKTGD
jgi:quercetin dioxygenase-like cupin family protein